MKCELTEISKTGIQTYRLENDNGMVAEVITYGARISKLVYQGIDVVAGFDDPEGFRGDNPYFNAVIGRFANRIGNASFTLNGKEYPLYKNDGNNHLHGGKEGFDRKIWKATVVGNCSVRMDYVSCDGEEGYPGNLCVSVTYSLDNEDALCIRYRAVSDKDTVCSLTNHAYFNLSGTFDTALHHELTIRADQVTAIDNELIPHGEIVDIKGTALDFTIPKLIGKDIQNDDTLLKLGNGYDFNYIRNNDTEEPIATAFCADSGIAMDVYTDRPCVQLYTGNFLDGVRGKQVYGFRSAFCLETQGYPNACNVPSFPSCVLRAGEEFRSYTAYLFRKP